MNGTNFPFSASAEVPLLPLCLLLFSLAIKLDAMGGLLNGESLMCGFHDVGWLNGLPMFQKLRFKLEKCMGRILPRMKPEHNLN